LELFKISDGPWEKFYDGKTQNSDMEIYTNPESMMLVLIYDKENGKVIGAVIELFKVFYSQGDAEHFVETLPRRITLINRHDGEKRDNKFLLLASEPTYATWNEKSFLDETDKLLKALKASSVLIRDVSKAYDLTLTDINNADEKAKGIFFSEPLVIPLVAESAMKEHVQATGYDALPKSITKGEVILGLTKDRQKIVEPLAIFSKSIVIDGGEADRKRVMQVIAESALLSSISIVIFDGSNSFDGIGHPTSKRDDLRKYELEQEPIGFPVKKFDAASELKVDLSVTSPAGFAEIFGIGENVVSKIIISTIEKNRPASLKELIAKVRELPPGDEPSAFDIGKAVRVLTLIGNTYPRMFDGHNNIGAMVKSGTRALGKANIINISKTDERLTLLISHNIMSSIKEYFRQGKASGGMGFMVLLPKASKIHGDSQKILEKEINTMLAEYGKIGLGFVLSEDKEIDIPQDVLKEVEARLNIVSGNDVGVQLSGRKSYRVLVRPTLSRE